MFKIGDFSKISQVSMRMLRHYDELGLLKPAHVDPFTGYRSYSADQLPRLNRILALKDLGLSLEEIGRLLDDDLPASELRGMLRLKQAELRQHVDEDQRRLARVESRIQQIEDEGALPRYETLLKPVKPQRVLSLREVAPSLHDMGDLLFQALLAVRRSVRQSGHGIAVFYDAQFEHEHLDWEVGFTVGDDVTDPLPLGDGRELQVRELPAIDLVASTIYEGSYLGLHLGYSALGAWIEANGYQIQGPNREIFLHIAPDESERHVTEIQFPVVKLPSQKRADKVSRKVSRKTA